MHNSDICVGIVCYNTSRDILRKTVYSLRTSSRHTTIVLYCNSSDARYNEICASLASEYDCLFLEKRPNRGFGAAHNEIFATYGKHFKWYVCCNPDVYVTEHAIENLINMSDNLPASIILGPKVLNMDGTTQYLSRNSLTIFNWLHRQLARFLPGWFQPFEFKFDYNQLQSVEFISGCFFAIKSEYFVELKGFDEDFFLYYEDADLSRRALTLGTNYFVPQSIVYHEWGRAWTTSYKAFKRQIKSLIKYFSKHGLLSSR